MLRRLLLGPTNRNQQLKAALTTTKAERVMEEKRRHESLQRAANRTNVTQHALSGTELTADMSHEILHVATCTVALTAIMKDRPR